ncbi:alpha/beta fold hydrolase [Streptomyces sp. NPDC001985]|uniref:alpha/beta fold hydrolase n=1 Tax=Streptomyces sp. NPDC001985 TaxID=3154406 RepID=UPI0033171BD4
MPVARINGINLSYDTYGSGEPVIMVTGTGAPGRVWRTHQVPALRRAGYRVITVDNRGIPPTDVCPQGFTLADMVADLAALIEHMGEGPCRLVGTSMGGILVQELLVSRPELVRQAVLIASSGRTDTLLAAMSAGDIELADSGVKIPPRYAAYIQALQNLSPATLNDKELLQDWLTVLEMSPVDISTARGQLGLDVIPDRLAVYRRINRPCLVIAFADDLVVRPHLSREVADSIPGARYTEIPGAGHYGYLEKPTAVNSAITDFFAR